MHLLWSCGVNFFFSTLLLFDNLAHIKYILPDRSYDEECISHHLLEGYLSDGNFRAWKCHSLVWKIHFIYGHFMHEIFMPFSCIKPFARVTWLATSITRWNEYMITIWFNHLVSPFLVFVFNNEPTFFFCWCISDTMFFNAHFTAYIHSILHFYDHIEVIYFVLLEG